VYLLKQQNHLAARISMETTMNIASRLTIEVSAIVTVLALVEWGSCWYIIR
jgi:hypothetical protein